MRVEKITYTDVNQDIDPRIMLRLGHKKAKSKLGQTYTFLLRDDGRVVMSDTEYERQANQPFFDKVAEMPDEGHLLLIGWGIGFVIPIIRSLKPDVKITCIEKYQEVLDFFPPDDDITIIHADVNDVRVTDLGQYDLIYYDTDEPFENKATILSCLKKEGEYLSFRGM